MRAVATVIVLFFVGGALRVDARAAALHGAACETLSCRVRSWYDRHCPAATLKCSDGTCAAPWSSCPVASTQLLLGCPKGDWTCPDGTCVPPMVPCGSSSGSGSSPAGSGSTGGGSGCPNGEQLCPDGSCVPPGTSCSGSQSGCGSSARMCPDGSCVPPQVPCNTGSGSGSGGDLKNEKVAQAASLPRCGRFETPCGTGCIPMWACCNCGGGSSGSGQGPAGSGSGSVVAPTTAAELFPPPSRCPRFQTPCNGGCIPIWACCNCAHTVVAARACDTSRGMHYCSKKGRCAPASHTKTC